MVSKNSMTEKELLHLLGNVYEEYKRSGGAAPDPQDRERFLKACREEEHRQIRKEAKRKLLILAGIFGSVVILIAALLMLIL